MKNAFDQHEESILDSQLKASLEITEMLQSPPYNCTNPAFAWYQIKRSLKAGKKPTIKQIIKWGATKLGRVKYV